VHQRRRTCLRTYWCSPLSRVSSPSPLQEIGALDSWTDMLVSWRKSSIRVNIPVLGETKTRSSDHAWFLQPWLPPLLTCQRHRAALKSLLFTLAVVLCRLFLPVHRLEKCGHGSAYISGDALLIHLRSLDEISRLHSLTAHQKRACLNRQPLTTVRSNHSCVDW